MNIYMRKCELIFSISTSRGFINTFLEVEVCSIAHDFEIRAYYLIRNTH